MLIPSTRDPFADARGELLRRSMKDLLGSTPARVLTPNPQWLNEMRVDGRLSPRHGILFTAEPKMRVEPLAGPAVGSVPIEVCESPRAKPGILTVIVGTVLEEIPILGDLVDDRFQGTLQDRASQQATALIKRAVQTKSLPNLETAIVRAVPSIAAAAALRQGRKQILRLVLGSAAGPVGWAILGASAVTTLIQRLWKP